jgi:hypothetical protein
MRSHRMDTLSMKRVSTNKITSDIELLNGCADNLVSGDKAIVARGSIYLAGHEIGCWNVRTGSRWSACLTDTHDWIQSNSKDGLKRAIAMKVDSQPLPNFS